MPLPFIAYVAIAAGGALLVKVLKDDPELRKSLLDSGVKIAGSVNLVNEIDDLADMDETAAMKHLDVMVPSYSTREQWDAFRRAFSSLNSNPDYPYERKVKLNRLLTYAERVHERTATDE